MHIYTYRSVHTLTKYTSIHSCIYNKKKVLKHTIATVKISLSIHGMVELAQRFFLALNNNEAE